MSDQQCISWYPLQEVEPGTPYCWAETLQLSQQLISHLSDAKLTSHGNYAANAPEYALQITSVLFTEDTVTSRVTSFSED